MNLSQTSCLPKNSATYSVDNVTTHKKQNKDQKLYETGVTDNAASQKGEIIKQIKPQKVNKTKN